jgi:outer membrane protein OmpA-like peptidoglycan-associated protein
MKNLLIAALGVFWGAVALAEQSDVSVVSLSGKQFTSADFVNSILDGVEASEKQSESVSAKPLSAKVGDEPIKYRSFVIRKQKPEVSQEDLQAVSHEAAREIPPNSSACPVQKRGIAISIQFGVNSYDIQPDGYEILEQVAEAMNTEKLRACNFLLEGHTDASGQADYNRQLSYKRAEAVRNFLAYSNVVSDRLGVVGKGEEEPLDLQNPYADVNRRVQFMVGN